MSSADMYWELTLPGRESSPPLSSFPKFAKGGILLCRSIGYLLPESVEHRPVFLWGVVSFSRSPIWYIRNLVFEHSRPWEIAWLFLLRVYRSNCFFRESLFHDPCVVTVGHVGYRYRIFAQGVYDESPVADTFGCRQFDFYVAVVWSKDFVIHLFAVGFVAKLAKKRNGMYHFFIYRCSISHKSLFATSFVFVVSFIFCRMEEKGG